MEIQGWDERYKSGERRADDLNFHRMARVSETFFLRLFFQLGKQTQRVSSIDCLHVIPREFVVLESIDCDGDAHEGKVGPKEQLRFGNELRQRGKGRRIAAIGGIEI